jgi:hypothetical protein
MEKEIKLSIPTSYADISLKKYLELQNELETYKDDEEATTAVLLYRLCGLEPKYLSNISFSDLAIIKTDLEKFLGKTDFELAKFVTIDGVEYGFEPNLSQIAYGAYLDITKYDTLGINENWKNVMDILYRPVERKKGDYYSIKPYDGKIDGSKWEGVSMDIHFGCLFFFINLLMDLAKGILKYTKTEDLPLNLKSILERSGKVIQQSQNLLMGI